MVFGILSIGGQLFRYKHFTVFSRVVSWVNERRIPPPTFFTLSSDAVIQRSVAKTKGVCASNPVESSSIHLRHRRHFNFNAKQKCSGCMITFHRSQPNEYSISIVWCELCRCVCVCSNVSVCDSVFWPDE